MLRMIIIGWSILGSADHLPYPLRFIYTGLSACLNIDVQNQSIRITKHLSYFEYELNIRKSWAFQIQKTRVISSLENVIRHWFLSLQQKRLGLSTINHLAVVLRVNHRGPRRAGRPLTPMAIPSMYMELILNTERIVWTIAYGAALQQLPTSSP